MHQFSLFHHYYLFKYNRITVSYHLQSYITLNATFTPIYAIWRISREMLPSELVEMTFSI